MIDNNTSLGGSILYEQAIVLGCNPNQVRLLSTCEPKMKFDLDHALSCRSLVGNDTAKLLNEVCKDVQIER